jgi:hypothetical protein
MKKGSSFQLTDSPPALSEVEISAVRDQLARLLASSAFRNSKRYPEFLRYAVEHALDGDTENIKERVLGVEVFGRPATYDTNSDPVVRMTAAEVRKRLEQYYGGPGRANEIRIDFPKGSYIPEFSWPQPGKAVEYTLPLIDPVPKTSPEKHGHTTAYAVVFGLLVAAVAWAIFSTRETAMDRFWSPIFDSTKPVLLCIPDMTSSRRGGFAASPQQSGPNSPLHSQGFLPSLAGTRGTTNDQSAPRSDGRAEGLLNPGLSNVSSQTPAAQGSDPAQDNQGWQRDEVSFVDTFTVMQVSNALARRGRSFRLFHTEDASLEDLQQGPAVLIGGTNNPWINQVSSELRFALARDGQLAYISDRQNPSSRAWSVMYQNSPTDYAIISRIFNTMTGQPVVIAAGVRRAGTEAAGKCFSDTECFAEAEKLAPGDWKHANLQFIVETKVVNEVPGQPKVIAAYLVH